MTDTFDQADLMPRLTSGVPGLDIILKGGFLQGGTYIIMGAPGTGKTILSNQICYHQAAQSGRALYITLLAESHARLLAHLRSMSFFNIAAVSHTIQYISGYHTLETEGLRGLLRMIQKEIRSHQATVLILDGLATVEAIIESDLSLKHFLHDLQAYNETTRCTSFLLTLPTLETNDDPGHPVVDGIVELCRQHAGPRSIRELEVHKLRGSEFLEGRHRILIAQDGVTAYPRIEVLLKQDASYDDLPTTRMDFGIQRLDEMLYGGIPSSSTTLLLGAPGTGKTVLGLHFLAAGAGKDEPGLYYGFYERPQRLIYKANLLGLDFSALIDSGRIRLHWQPALEAIPDALAQEILTLVREHGIKRLFLDGIEGFENAEVYPERTTPFFTALSNQLRAMNVTTVFTAELTDLFSPTISVPIGGVSATVDNIFFLRYVELRSQLYRLISIMKMRESAYESAIREFQITETGIDVAPTFVSAEAILTGVARPSARHGDAPSSFAESPS